MDGKRCHHRGGQLRERVRQPRLPRRVCQGHGGQGLDPGQCGHTGQQLLEFILLHVQLYVLSSVGNWQKSLFLMYP